MHQYLALVVSGGKHYESYVKLVETLKNLEHTNSKRNDFQL